MGCVAGAGAGAGGGGDGGGDQSSCKAQTSDICCREKAWVAARKHKSKRLIEHGSIARETWLQL